MKIFKLLLLAAVALVAIAAAVTLTRSGWRPWGHEAGRTTAVADPAASRTSGASAPAAAAQGPPSIRIGPQRLERIGVTTAVAEEKTVADEIRTTGNVEVDEQKLSSVQLRFPGWIQKAYVNSTYQRVVKGQPLFTIYSPDLVTTEQEYLLARKNQRLLADSSVPGVSGGAASLLAAARERLLQWGVPAREIDTLERTGTPRQELEIDSPASGYVTEWHALPQTYVQPAMRLYTIADLSTVWVYAAVFQSDIGRIRIGDPGTVIVDSYPGRTFRGRVDYVWPQVDESTRTVKVRLVFPNPGVKLMPGMFVNVAISAPLGRHLVVPASAVFQTGTHAEVFIDRGGGVLEPRQVETGPRAGDDLIVLRGLQPGDRVVDSAQFLIDSESQLQAAVGAFAPPSAGGGPVADQGANPAGTVGLTTDPSPPHKGGNLLRVALTDADDRPISGAQVDVTFFMPAMPAMGMPAARAQATLHETTPGRYEGPITLPAAGTWQVTVRASRQGTIVARQQLTVSAAGGM